MRRDEWTETTIPTRPVKPGRDAARPGKTRPLERVGILLLAGIALLLLLAVCGLWGIYLLRDRIARAGPTPTFIIWTPTATPFAPSTLPPASPTPLPTEISAPTPTSSPEIAIGKRVRVSGTGGYGLSLRAGPAENYTRMDIAQEGEEFIVVDGPTVAGDAVWWKVRDPQNVEREWWAVGNYLQPVEQP